MMNYKKEIETCINKIVELNNKELQGFIEIPPDENMGDFSFPCFRLAKELKKSPVEIAEKISKKIILNEEMFEKIQVVGAYINFFVNKKNLIKDTLTQIDINKENYGKSTLGEGKNIIVEYSSPNIAKPFHIGHLRNTVIGAALYNMYKFLGYNVTGINHLGDYGTQFGKMIEGYKRWGTKYDLNENPIEKLTQIYIRINELCKKDENVLNECRNNFKKLEDGEEYCTKIWNEFKDLSLKEFYKIYDLLGVHFDSSNGEAFYSDKMQEIEDILEKSGKLQLSEGAQIINLEDQKLGVCMIKKSNGSTTYATRDLAAILYRARTYDFDKCLYVVAYEQNLHFKQIFEVAKLLGLDEKYIKGLQHIPYGMVHLKEGRMSTREGNVIKVDELLKEAIQRVKNVIEEKNPDMENLDENAQKIGIGAVVFYNLATTIIKDQVFDWNLILNFNGETGPYIQYTYVRTNSVIKNAEGIPNIENINFSKLLDDDSIKIIKTISQFNKILENAVLKNEPSILARYLLELAKLYSTFYNNNKIIVEDKELKDARVYLTYATGNVLKIGMKLLGINMPDKM